MLFFAILGVSFRSHWLASWLRLSLTGQLGASNNRYPFEIGASGGRSYFLGQKFGFTILRCSQATFLSADFLYSTDHHASSCAKQNSVQYTSLTSVAAHTVWMAGTPPNTAQHEAQAQPQG